MYLSSLQAEETMSKSILKVVFIVFQILSVSLLWNLLKPEKTTTSAINKEIQLAENITETFTTDFSYGYQLSVVLIEDKYLTAKKPFDVILKKEGQILFNKKMKLDIDKNNHLVHNWFTADSGDSFELKIIGIDKSLIGKKVRIYADVTGGGPSVGIALTKALKPYLWITFGILTLMTTLLGIYSFKKTAARRAGGSASE